MGLLSDLIGLGAKAFNDVKDSFSTKLQIKVEKLPPKKGDMFSSFGIYVKGDPLASLDYPSCLIFKLYDKEKHLPILSTFEVASEDSTRVFEHTVSIGNMNSKYWPDWVQMSAVIPEALIGPHKGKRSLELRCFAWYEDWKPKFVNGFLPEGTKEDGFISTVIHEFEIVLGNVGYLEIDPDRLEVQKASIRLAVLISMADGALDISEGNEIKSWIEGIIVSSPQSQKKKIKDTLNQALEDAFQDAKFNNIDLAKVCMNIKDRGSKADKFNLVELCLDVMAADGEADKEELKQVGKIAEMVGVSYDEINKMKDKRLVKLNPNVASNASAEETLGINPSWSKEKINSHIITQYSKWNGRLNSLPEGTERENAQKMLDLIAEARKKYS